MQFHIVVTTIQKPTESLRKMASTAGVHGARLVVMGDRKSPPDFDLENTDYFPIDQQRQLPFKLAARLPENHYTRKNLGYLQAIKSGAGAIFETDDDNHPQGNWQPRHIEQEASHVSQKGWCNVYRYFSRQNIWPRGFPLECIRNEVPDTGNGQLERDAFPVQQSLADGSPDVDAVWRLVLDTEIVFEKNPPIALGEGTWCPFNSQATWWWPEAFPFLYLPSFCSFRMTDIWRSFVAQRCLWANGRRLLFHNADMYQDRNEHDLLKDFRDEVDGYLNNNAIARCLQDAPLQGGKSHENLLTCYQHLVEGEFIPESEMPLVEAWIEDMRGLSPV